MFTKESIEKYFLAEKAASWIFIAIGIAGITAAIVAFFFLKTSFYKGVAIPLILIGLLVGIMGFTVYKRSDEDRKRNVYAFGLNPGELKEKELPRMKVVMNNFVLYRYIEIALALLGVVLFFYFNNKEAQLFWKGFGMALAIVALLALTADYFAEKRGYIYLTHLKDFINN